MWMPRRLLKSGSVELNHLTARGREGLYVAFMNQSRESVTTEIAFNASVLPQVSGKTYRTRVAKKGAVTELRDGRMTVTVPPMGLTAVEIEGLVVRPKFQDRLVGAKASDAWRTDYLELTYGGGRAMILNFGPAATTAYVYLQADDAKFKEVSLSYEVGGKRETIRDVAYPFEFTVPITTEARDFKFQIQGVTVDGQRTAGEWSRLVK
jgi:hypothetical protein